MKKAGSFVLMMLCVFLCGTFPVCAAETPKKPSAAKQILDVQGRGFVNLFTFPGEWARTLGSERKEHPKAWPVTYMPRSFFNMVARAVSGVHDVAVLPWYVTAGGDNPPVTHYFDLPDYVWQKT